MKEQETKAIFLRGVKPDLYAWVKKTSKDQGYTMSGLVNKIFEQAKKNACNK
jgi:hypothetical protein